MLTSRQSDIYTFIRGRILEGFPPTIAEVQKFMGVSRTAANAAIGVLVRKGFLRRADRIARGLGLSPTHMTVRILKNRLPDPWNPFSGCNFEGFVEVEMGQKELASVPEKVYV